MNRQTGVEERTWLGSYRQLASDGRSVYQRFEARQVGSDLCFFRVNISAQGACEIPPADEAAADRIFARALAKVEAERAHQAKLEATRGVASPQQIKLVTDALAEDIKYWNQATLDVKSLRDFHTHPDKDYPLMVRANFAVLTTGGKRLDNVVDAVIKDGKVRCMRITGPSGNGYCDPPRNPEVIAARKRAYESFFGSGSSQSQQSCTPQYSQSFDRNGGSTVTYRGQSCN